MVSTNTQELLILAIDQDKLELAPTFAFIDPFGYSNFPMTTIARFMSNKRCEVLITFMYDFVNRFSDIQKSAINELYGDSDWQNETIPTESEARKDFLLGYYESKLRTIAKVKHIRSFEMVRKDGHTEYYLVFGTNHPKGMDVMKNAMYAVDSRGTYRFSDRADPHQTYLTDVTEESAASEAARLVFEKFKGQTVPVPQIKEFVWISKFRYKNDILKVLESQQPPKIKVLGRKRGGFNYPDTCIIEFVSE